MSESLKGAIIIAGTALSIIFIPMLWNAYLNKREERKKKREQQYKLAMDKAREKQVAFENIVKELESNRRCVDRARLSLADIRTELSVYEMETRCKSILEKDKYESIRVERLVNNVKFLRGELSELEESLENVKCQLYKYECGMIRDANQ